MPDNDTQLVNLAIGVEVRRIQAEAWREGALWAAVECAAIGNERQRWLAPGDNPYEVQHAS